MCRGFHSSNNTCWPELYPVATCLFGYKFASCTLVINILTYSHCRIYFNLLLRERRSRNLALVTSQTMKHIYIHFPQDASDDDVLAVLKDASARV